MVSDTVNFSRGPDVQIQTVLVRWRQKIGVAVEFLVIKASHGVSGVGKYCGVIFSK